MHTDSMRCSAKEKGQVVDLAFAVSMGEAGVEPVTPAL